MSVHCLPGTGIDCNVFLIDGTDPILVDTGTGENLESMLRKVSKRVPLRSIRRVVLTHCHFDHVGGADELVRRLDAELMAHAEDAEVLRKGDGQQTLSLMFGVPGCKLDVATLDEGTRLSTGTHEFQVLHTPGHTSGSICIFEESTGILISGDTVFAEGVGRWDFPSGDLEALRSSVTRLGRLNVKDVFPGHGPSVLGDGKRTIEEAIGYLGEC